MGKPRSISSRSTTRPRSACAASRSTSRTLEYESATRHYAHADCPGHADYVKNMNHRRVADGTESILLVDATRRVPEAQTARALAVSLVRSAWSNLVVFVNKVDVADPELVDLVVIGDRRSRPRARLHRAPPSSAARRSAPVRALDEGLLDDPHVESIRRRSSARSTRTIPDPARDYGAPFLMPVQDTCTITGLGTVVTRPRRARRDQVGETVEIVGRPDAVVVKGIQSFHKDREMGPAPATTSACSLRRRRSRRGGARAT